MGKVIKYYPNEKIIEEQFRNYKILKRDNSYFKYINIYDAKPIYFLKHWQKYGAFIGIPSLETQREIREFIGD